MVKKKVVYLACVVILISGFFVGSTFTERSRFSTPDSKPISTNAKPVISKVIINNNTFTVEVANTDQKRMQGLSSRTQLPQDGMLFEFPTADNHSFWMKEMNFDLDFIWIHDGKVVDITANVPRPQPGQSLQTLPVYTPQKPASSMWEARAGFVAEQNIQIGDSITISD